MSNPITFKQAQSDYIYIKEKYGEPNDFCGTLCNCELLFELLDGKISRKEAYIQMIEYIWDNGIEDPDSGTSSDIRPDEDDARIQKIKERYFIK